MDYITSALMSGATSGLTSGISSAISSGISGLFGGGDDAEDAIREQNAFNSAQAGLQRDWLRRMSNTAHQREVRDLKLAGLNPMLSVVPGGHGASTPEIGPVRQDVNRAMIEAQLKQANANTAMAVSQSIKSRSEAAVNYASLPKIAQETATSQSSAHLMETQATETASRRVLNMVLSEKGWYEMNKIMSETNLTKAEELLVRQETANAVLEGRNIEAHTGNVKVDTVLKELAIPLARNEARVQSSYWKENVSPYLDDAGRVIGSAAAAVGGAVGIKALLSHGNELFFRSRPYRNRR